MNKEGFVLRLFEREGVKKLIGKKDSEKKLWALLVLNIWFKKYFLNNES